MSFLSSVPIIGELFKKSADIIDKVVPDKDLAMKLKHELEMVSFEQQKMAMDDLSNARDREVKIQTTGSMISKIATPVIAYATITLSFLLFYIVVFSGHDIAQGKKEIIMYILGVLSAISSQIYSYYFGSSMGSRDKAETIKALTTMQSEPPK